MSGTPQLAPTRIKIWQKNLNKSRVAQEDLINSDIYRNYDILALQEPYIDAYGNTKATRDWRVVYPSSLLSNSSLPRVVMLISNSINTNHWAQLHILNMQDLIAIRISNEFGKLTIFNLYNNCQNSDTIDALEEYLASQPQAPHPSHPDYSIWCGDFNHHHPMWDEEWHHHLFTAGILEDSGKLLILVADSNMVMGLPKDIPTLESMSTKNWTHPDNIFCSSNLEEKIVYCTTDPRLQGPGTDHVPILTALEFPVARISEAASYNFRAIDWEAFRMELTIRLSDFPDLVMLSTNTAFQTTVCNLTNALQDTVRTTVPHAWPSPHSKRWWSNELTTLKGKKNKLSNMSYKYHTMPSHPIHKEHRVICRLYSEAITTAK